MKAVSLSLPHIGGTYTVFLNLRKGLKPHGVDLTWLAAGKQAFSRVLESASPEDRASGVVVAQERDDEVTRANALRSYIVDNDVDLVIFHALSGTAETNLARYLPTRVRRILMVHNITPATYRAGRAVRDWAHATVGVGPRITSDLVRHHGFDPDWTFTVANGVDLAAFNSSPRTDGVGPLRILSLGRVEDISKGVLWFPRILRRAIDAGADVSLTVAGDGPDLEELKRRFQPLKLGERLCFMGRTPPDEVPRLMAETDVFLFPSRFEGFGLALVEAMAAGCVPVASRIGDVTDFVVEDGKSGLLFPVGNVRRAADHLVRLAGDRGVLARLREAARESAFNRFGIEQQAAAFHAIVRKVLKNPRPLRDPIRLHDWRIPRGLRPGWWYRMPEPVKNYARRLRERKRSN